MSEVTVRSYRREEHGREETVHAYDKRAPREQAEALVRRRIDASALQYRKESFGLGPDDKLADHFELVPRRHATQSLHSDRTYHVMTWGVKVGGRPAGYVASNYDGTRHKFLPYYWEPAEEVAEGFHGTSHVFTPGQVIRPEDAQAAHQGEGFPYEFMAGSPGEASHWARQHAFLHWDQGDHAVRPRVYAVEAVGPVDKGTSGVHARALRVVREVEYQPHGVITEPWLDEVSRP